jgi:DNA-binding winged helix-turn-helix (wHTH) protein
MGVPFSGMRARFLGFTLDTDRHELRSGGAPVHLTPKAFQLLQILVECRPRAIAQQELYDRLWPDTLVEKSNVHNLVYQLREALADRDQQIIRTVYGFGFSFAAGASVEAPAVSSWSILVGDQEFPLVDGENIVGRERDSVVRIDDPSISRRHARLVVSPESVTVEDLRSKNGTSLGGRRIHAAGRLADGDLIVFGTVAAILRMSRGAPSTQTVL